MPVTSPMTRALTSRLHIKLSTQHLYMCCPLGPNQNSCFFAPPVLEILLFH